MLDLKKLDTAFRNLGFMPRPVEIQELVMEIQKEKEKEKALEKKKDQFKQTDVAYSSIDYPRFKQIMAKKMVKDQSLNELKKAFKILDTDGSGSIEASEFRVIM